MNLRLFMTSSWCLFALSSWTCAEDAQNLKLSEGTVVRVRITENIQTRKKGGVKVGEIINFNVVNDVNVNGRIVIRQNAAGTGTITVAKRAKSFGRKGSLDFTIDYVDAVDGQKVPIRSTSKAVAGKGRKGVMAATVLFVSVLGVFIRGKQAIVEKGTEFDVYVDRDKSIKMK